MRRFPPFAGMLAGFLLLSSGAVLAGALNFLFVGSGELAAHDRLLARPDIAGAQVVYSWKQLEPAADRYDFSPIERDLRQLGRHRKKLFIQIQDRFFRPEDRLVPDYLLHGAAFRGGLTAQLDRPGELRPPTRGWVAQQWNPAVQERFRKLLKALGARFDGRVYGINLPETAIDIDQRAAHAASGFSCDRYFAAEVQNLQTARLAFGRSRVVQYVNFWPCEWNNDRRYMQRLFAFAANNGIGLGGPDVIPHQRAQMHNAYPFFHHYKGRLPLVAMAIQAPTLTYRDPATGRPFDKAALTAFAVHYLGARILFWTPQAPWLSASAHGTSAGTDNAQTVPD